MVLIELVQGCGSANGSPFDFGYWRSAGIDGRDSEDMRAMAITTSGKLFGALTRAGAALRTGGLGLALLVGGCAAFSDVAPSPLPSDGPLMTADGGTGLSNNVRRMPGVMADPATTTVGGRVPVDPAVWPWSAIGRLEIDGDRRCTGTLVGSRQVLTSAYCLVGRGSGEIVAGDRITFSTGIPGTGGAIEISGRQVVLSPAYRTAAQVSTGRTVLNTADNWALVILREDPPVPPIQWQARSTAEIAALQPVGTLALVGFQVDQPHVLSGDFNCRVTGASGEPGLVLQACDARPGDGGSPLLYESNGEWQVLVAMAEPGVAGPAPELPLRPDAFGNPQIYPAPIGPRETLNDLID